MGMLKSGIVQDDTLIKRYSCRTALFGINILIANILYVGYTIILDYESSSNNFSYFSLLFDYIFNEFLN